MPKFCFFLRIDRQIIEDWSGREMPDLETAERFAQLEYPNLFRSISPHGPACVVIEIREPGGRLLAVVPTLKGTLVVEPE